MTYLIDPIVFYWMSVLDGLESFMLVVGSMLAIAMVFIYVWYFLDKTSSYSTGYSEFVDKTLKPIPIIITLLICFLVPVFIPSQDTMIKMLVASQVTTGNIEVVQKSATELIDYIVDKINEVDKEE